MGRTATKVDLDELHKLGVIHATIKEVAGWFGLSDVSIDTRLADAQTYEFEGQQKTFREIFEEGKAKGKCSLRRKQVELAQAGNPTMLIWLGKQLLGQKDQSEIGAAPGQEINVRIRKTVDKP